MKAEVLANKAANKNEKAFETIKPKMDNLNPNLGNKNFNNYFGLVLYFRSLCYLP